MSTENPTATEAAAEKALRPVRKFVFKAAGNARRLAERLTKVTGENVYRQSIEGWIHPDPTKRVQPRLGMGLIMLATVKRLEAEDRK